MITQYRIMLGSIAEHRLYSDSAYHLYACLLEQLEEDAAQWLHEYGMVSQFLDFSKGDQCYHWTLNLLNDDTAAVLNPVMEKLTSVTIENQEFPILERSVEVVGLEDLLSRGREVTHSCDSFMSLSGPWSESKVKLTWVTAVTEPLLPTG